MDRGTLRPAGSAVVGVNASALLAAEYVLPLRWSNDMAFDDLDRYLRTLSDWIDITVVDGSPPPVFEAHSRAWSGLARHCPPDPAPPGNGKVAGVLTGLRVARHDHVVIADDDVRYDLAALTQVLALLSSAEIVRPQNYFSDYPWHAKWDAARTLVNRAFGSDYPGTLAVRRSALPTGYRQDVLFENLELIRTVEAGGGRQCHADDLLVARRPPTVRHFLRQRVRQAYDDLAQPVRLAMELALLPAVLLARPFRTRGVGVALGEALTVVILAAVGRGRGRGARHFPAVTPLWAPVWLAERSVCAWLAVALVPLGGVRYGGIRLRSAASSRRRLSRRSSPGTEQPIGRRSHHGRRPHRGRLAGRTA